MRNKSKSAWILIACIAIAVLSTTGTVLAKYITEWRSDPLNGEPDDFIFTSDYLTEAGQTYTIYGDSVTFKIMNYDAFDNHAKLDVSYTLSGGLEDTGTFNGNQKDFKEYTVERKMDKSVTVTAESSAPYEKRISATFKFADKNTTRVNAETYDEDNHIVLHIYTGADVTENTEFHILGQGFAPDNSNPLMREWKYEEGDYTAACTDEILTGLQPNSHYELIFFARIPIQSEVKPRYNPNNNEIVFATESDI